MHHHRQAELFRRLARDVERDEAGILGSVQADANLDADDRVAIGARDLDRFGRRHQPEVAALADHDAPGEPVDPGERYVEIGEDPHRSRWADDMLQESGIIARPRAAGVDERRASATSETERVDPQRSAAPIDMGMEVDEARRDDKAADVLDHGAGKLRANSRDAPILEADIRHRVDALGRIDDSAPSQNQIKLHQDRLSRTGAAPPSSELLKRQIARHDDGARGQPARLSHGS